MIKNRLIEFIKYYEKRKKDDNTEYTSFTVNVETGYKGEWYLPVFGQRLDDITILLDNEDLEYLYNKYFPQYCKAVKEEIEELEKKLNKLKNE